jgi:DNA-binding transcriptional regulator YhcF (GntR family)
LAADLGLARGTVAKVYEQLARAGLVLSAGRHGTVVAPAQSGTVDAAAAQSKLHDAAWRLALLAHQLGIGLPGARAALDAAASELQELELPPDA